MEEEEELSKNKRLAGRKQTKDYDEDEAQLDEDEGDASWWGSSRKEYYDNDEIEDEDDALEEEREARR